MLVGFDLYQTDFSVRLVHVEGNCDSFTGWQFAFIQGTLEQSKWLPWLGCVVLCNSEKLSYGPGSAVGAPIRCQNTPTQFLTFKRSLLMAVNSTVSKVLGVQCDDPDLQSQQ